MAKHESTRLLKVREVAALLGVSISYVYSRTGPASRLGTIPYIRLGGRRTLRFDSQDVLAWARGEPPVRRRRQKQVES